MRRRSRFLPSFIEWFECRCPGEKGIIRKSKDGRLYIKSRLGRIYYFEDFYAETIGIYIPPKKQ